MRRIIISLIALAAVFSCTSLFAQETEAGKKLYIKAQVDRGEIQSLGSVIITSPKSSLKVMCEDEKGNVISTFIIPTFEEEPAAAKK